MSPRPGGGAVAIGPVGDGGMVAAGQVAGAALLVRFNSTGETVRELRCHGASLAGLTLLPDGRAAAAGERQGRMWVLRLGY